MDDLGAPGNKFAVVAEITLMQLSSKMPWAAGTTLRVSCVRCAISPHGMPILWPAPMFVGATREGYRPRPVPVARVVGLDTLWWEDDEADAGRCEQTTEADRNCSKQCATRRKGALVMLHPVSVARCNRISHAVLGADDKFTCAGCLLSA